DAAIGADLDILHGRFADRRCPTANPLLQTEPNNENGNRHKGKRCNERNSSEDLLAHGCYGHDIGRKTPLRCPGPPRATTVHRKTLNRKNPPPAHIRIATARMRIANTSQIPKKVRRSVWPFWAQSGQIAVPRTHAISSSFSITHPQEPHLMATLSLSQPRP